MHRGAIPRPSGVTSVQNQLRRLCLSTNSTQAHPQLQNPLYNTLVQSNGFATAATGSKTAKKPAAKKPKQKKELTEAQKEAKKVKAEKEHIKQLKVTALTPPKKLAQTFHALAVQSTLPGLKGQYTTMPEAFKLCCEKIKHIDGYEKQQLEDKAKENQAANNAAYEAWIKTHTPLQIKQANVARRALFHHFKSNKYMQLKDDRLIKKPVTAYTAYTTEVLNSGNYNAHDQKGALFAVSQEWKNVSESEKQRYQKLAEEDLARYIRQHNEVYGYPPPTLKTKAEKA